MSMSESQFFIERHDLSEPRFCERHCDILDNICIVYVMCPILDHEMFLCRWFHKMENTENIVNSNTPSCSAINFTLKSTILTIFSIFLTHFWKPNVSAKFYFKTCIFTFGCCIPPPWQVCTPNQVQSTRRVKMTFQCQAAVNAMSAKKNMALSHFGPCPILGHPPLVFALHNNSQLLPLCCCGGCYDANAVNYDKSALLRLWRYMSLARLLLLSDVQWTNKRTIFICNDRQDNLKTLISVSYYGMIQVFRPEKLIIHNVNGGV